VMQSKPHRPDPIQPRKPPSAPKRALRRTGDATGTGAPVQKPGWEQYGDRRTSAGPSLVSVHGVWQPGPRPLLQDLREEVRRSATMRSELNRSSIQARQAARPSRGHLRQKCRQFFQGGQG
jgi:hypothetical protein